MTIGKRLIEERKRLGLSQSDFARQCEVSLSTQKRYEINEREPGTGYLENIRKLGADVAYILTGRRSGGEAAGVDFETLGELGLALVKLLGITSGDLQLLMSSVDKSIRQQFACRDGDENTFSDYRDSFFVHASDLLSRKIAHRAGELDQSLLEAVILAVESTGKSQAVDKKAKLITMLYRASLHSGKVETGLLADIISFSEG